MTQYSLAKNLTSNVLFIYQKCLNEHLCLVRSQRDVVLTDKDIGNGSLARLTKQVLLNSITILSLVQPERNSRRIGERQKSQKVRFKLYVLINKDLNVREIVSEKFFGTFAVMAPGL